MSATHVAPPSRAWSTARGRRRRAAWWTRRSRAGRGRRRCGRSAQQRRDAVPGGVRARVAVQQEDRRAGAAVAHAQRRLADVDVLEREALEEHAPRHTRARARASAGPRDGNRTGSAVGPGGRRPARVARAARLTSRVRVSAADGCAARPGCRRAEPPPRAPPLPAAEPPRKPPPPKSPARPLAADEDVALICVAVIVPLGALGPLDDDRVAGVDGAGAGGRRAVDLRVAGRLDAHGVAVAVLDVERAAVLVGHRADGGVALGAAAARRSRRAPRPRRRRRRRRRRAPPRPPPARRPCACVGLALLDLDAADEPDARR